jgi:hypothetical protein
MTGPGPKYDAAANYKAMAAELAELRATAERRLAMLRRLEWNKDGHCNGCTGFLYPSGSMTYGHEPGCWVAAELAANAKNTPPPK